MRWSLLSRGLFGHSEQRGEGQKQRDKETAGRVVFSVGFDFRDVSRAQVGLSIFPSRACAIHRRAQSVSPMRCPVSSPAGSSREPHLDAAGTRAVVVRALLPRALDVVTCYCVEETAARGRATAAPHGAGPSFIPSPGAVAAGHTALRANVPPTVSPAVTFLRAAPGRTDTVPGKPHGTLTDQNPGIQLYTCERCCLEARSVLRGCRSVSG